MQLLPSIDAPSRYKAKTQPLESLRRGLKPVQKPTSAFLQRQGFTEEYLKKYEIFIESLKSKGYAQINPEELIELNIIKEVISGILKILAIRPIPFQWGPPFTETKEEKVLNKALDDFNAKIKEFIQKQQKSLPKQQQTLPMQYRYRTPYFDLRLLYAQMRDSIVQKIKLNVEKKQTQNIKNKPKAYYFILYNKWFTLLKQLVQIENDLAYLKVVQKGKFHVRLYLFNKRIKDLSLRLLDTYYRGCFVLN